MVGIVRRALCLRSRNGNFVGECAVLACISNGIAAIGEGTCEVELGIISLSRNGT